ncbi:MAG: murein L,D-transpeptidase [Verrucomicrobia subdivision 3 bacterium]|nr:murein L,D-transpeptidase [Limisphaerales bacterium]
MKAGRWIVGVILMGALAVLAWQRLPKPDRAPAAAQRVKPALEKALAAKGLRWGAPVFIRIFKEEKQLELWVDNGKQFQLFKTWAICKFSGELGPKLKEGDGQAPEGFYFVPRTRMNPRSRFHLSFNLGYPNTYDRARQRTGSALMVHGNCVSIGCYAMTDARIEEIYSLCDAALKNGQRFFRVHSFPFRMTEANMKRHGKSKWMSEWNNLKQGFDWFEKTKRPPNVTVSGKKYQFSADAH